MTGFLLKDILVNKKYILTSLTVTACYIVFGFMSNNMSFFIPFLMLFCSMFVLSTFSYDELAGWDMYAITMPITKKEIIYSKYILFLLLHIIAGVFSILTNALNTILIHQPFSKDFYVEIWLFTAAALVFNCIQIPLVVKMGPEKARFAIIAIILVPTLLFIGLNKLEQTEYLQRFLSGLLDHSNQLLLLSPIILLILIFFSMQISVSIFNKKEF